MNTLTIRCRPLCYHGWKITEMTNSKTCGACTHTPKASTFTKLCKCAKRNKDEWLTCIWSAVVNVLTEVEEKLCVVEWQLQLLAVLPGGTVSIHTSISPLFASPWGMEFDGMRQVHLPRSNVGVTKLIKPLLLYGLHGFWKNRNNWV